MKKQTNFSLVGLDWLNFFLADVQTGVGPFLAIYLAGYMWNEQQVGFALTISGIAGVITQTPAGALVDSSRSKRFLIAFGVIILAASSLLIAFSPSFWPVLIAQIFIGGTSSIFAPTICAISLGIVGRELFDIRQGRNQTFNSAGNVVAALLIGGIGYYISNREVFFLVAIFAIPTIASLALINPSKIDYARARGAENINRHTKVVSIRELFRDYTLLIFLSCVVMFHFANAAMLPLLGQMLAKNQGRSSMIFMSACVLTTQFIVMLIAAWSGRKASLWGRKPLLLIAFAALPIRGVLYTLAQSTELLVAIQILDGIGAGILGVVSVLVISDLTQHTGRFNLTLGAFGTAVGIGASLSQTIAGSIVQHYSYSTGFLFLSAIALLAFSILYFFMPETKQIPPL